MYVSPIVDEYNKAVEDYERDFKSKGERPRDKDWRPVRLAVRDVVIAMAVFRHEAKSNVILVRLCGTYDPQAIPGWSGTKFITILLLSQAFKTGSNMGIKFTYKVNEGKIPDMIQIMAADYGVELTHADEGVITPREARHLYLALTEFSTEARRKVMQLAVENIVSPERVCYMVHHKTFEKEEMESILLGAEYPELVLSGKVTPREHMLYNDVVLRLRDVILGGTLNRKLKQKETKLEDGTVVDVESDERYISIGFDSEFFAFVYDIQEKTPVPWTRYENWYLGESNRMVVLVRARDISDFEYYFQSDVEALHALKEKYGENNQYFLLSTRTIRGLGEKLNDYQNQLESIGVALMLCPQSIPQLDQDILSRLKDAESMRNEVATISENENSLDVIEPKSFNSTQVKLVALNSDYSDGVLLMSKLLEQAMYDEKELARGVNKFAVRDRYQRVVDRMQFLAYQALMSGKAEAIDVNADILTQLVGYWRLNPEQARTYRIASTFWFGNEHGNMLASSRAIQQNRQAKDFIESGLIAGKVVVVLQNKHGHSDGVTEGSLDTEMLEQFFVQQYVPDELDIYSHKDSFDDVVRKKLSKVVELAWANEAHSFNPSVVPHMVLTRVLHDFVYAEGQRAAINIIYTDGSQARPFPLYTLRQRNEKSLNSLRKEDELKIGMLSMRHAADGLDLIIDRYWFRNIEMSQSGLTGAEVDEKAYQITIQRLKELEASGKKLRMRFYQTGFQPVSVGFLRAVVEFLKSRQGKEPILEVIPYLHDHDDVYDVAEPWA